MREPPLLPDQGETDLDHVLGGAPEPVLDELCIRPRGDLVVTRELCVGEGADRLLYVRSKLSIHTVVNIRQITTTIVMNKLIATRH